MQHIKFIMYLRDNWILFVKISASIALSGVYIYIFFAHEYLERHHTKIGCGMADIFTRYYKKSTGEAHFINNGSVSISMTVSPVTEPIGKISAPGN